MSEALENQGKVLIKGSNLSQRTGQLKPQNMQEITQLAVWSSPAKEKIWLGAAL